jgi:hypothetical protein
MRLGISFARVQISFLDICIKSYRGMKILGEVWARQASAKANEQELTTSAQNGGQHE